MSTYRHPALLSRHMTTGIGVWLPGMMARAAVAAAKSLRVDRKQSWGDWATCTIVVRSCRHVVILTAAAPTAVSAGSEIDLSWRNKQQSRRLGDRGRVLNTKVTPPKVESHGDDCVAAVWEASPAPVAVARRNLDIGTAVDVH